jgi:hypothetical protein
MQYVEFPFRVGPPGISSIFLSLRLDKVLLARRKCAFAAGPEVSQFREEATSAGASC